MFGILTTLFSGPWALVARWAAIGIACLALFGYGYVKGHHSAELDFEKYRGGVEALGRQAEERTAKVIATHKLLTEKSNAENATAISSFRSRIASLRNAIPSSGIVPAAPATSARPDLIAFDRAEFIGATGNLIDGIRRIADEGSTATVDLNSARTWALMLDYRLPAQ